MSYTDNRPQRDSAGTGEGIVYLDNAATTQVAPEVAELVTACMRIDFGNPSSAHHLGITAERRVKTARRQLQLALGDEDGSLGTIAFTSGGTEADAIGVLGAARARAARGRTIARSATEHPAVIACCELLAGDGWQVTELAVDSTGAVTPESALAAMTDETTMLAVMLVNNELGTVNPIAQIATAVRQRRPDIHIHCDAVQALGKVPVDVGSLGVDSLAVSAHKLHGPKGVGAIWVRSRARISPLWAGGGQQSGVRSGTENVPGIAGFGLAAEQATTNLADHRAHWTQLGATLIEALRSADVQVHHNAQGAQTAPNILSLGFPGKPSEPLLHSAESFGVMVSAGSACSSAHKGPSHVLSAIGLADDVGTLRISFGRDTTQTDIDRAAQALIHATRSL